jgi:hypothetical protein
VSESRVNFAPMLRARERVVVHVDSPAARWIGALAVLSMFCWLILLLARDHDRDWQAAGRLAWSLTLLSAVALIARGIFLGRPVTAAHAWLALIAVLAGLGLHVLVFDLLGNLLIVGAGALLMWPTSARPNSAELPRVWSLVNMSKADPLAPIRDAGLEMLSLQRRRHGGHRLPHPDGLRGGQRRPDR